MAAIDKDIITTINDSFSLTIPVQLSMQELKENLAVYINKLIADDFNKLVNLLYRIDVSESLLKTTLKQNPEADAGMIIASLVIERQLQKLSSRKSYSSNRKDINEEDKW
jgi:hypothetical protein